MGTNWGGRGENPGTSTTLPRPISFKMASFSMACPKICASSFAARFVLSYLRSNIGMD